MAKKNLWEKFKDWVVPAEDEYESYDEPEEPNSVNTSFGQNQVEITQGQNQATQPIQPERNSQTTLFTGHDDEPTLGQSAIHPQQPLPIPLPDLENQVVLTPGRNLGNQYVPPPPPQPPETNRPTTQPTILNVEEPAAETGQEFSGWAPPVAEENEQRTTAQNNQQAPANTGLSPEELQALARQTLGFPIKPNHESKIDSIQSPDEDTTAGFVNFKNGGGFVVDARHIAANDIKPQDYGSAASMMVNTAKGKGWDSLALNGRDMGFMDHVFVEATLQGVHIDHANSQSYKQPTSNALEMLKKHCDDMNHNILDSNGQIDISKAFGLRNYDGSSSQPQAAPPTSLFETEENAFPEINQNWNRSGSQTSMPRMVPPTPRGPGM